MEFHCSFNGKIWRYGGEASWWFISLPIEDAEDLEKYCSDRKRNFGSIKVSAKIGQTEWQTSVFRDTKSNTYLLPVKAAVRRKERLEEGSTYEVILSVT